MDINYYKTKYEPIDGKWYISNELGSGAFGTVFEVERRDFTNAKSAMKIITIPNSQNEVRSYREENYDLDEQSVTSYFYGFVEEFTKEFEVMLKLKSISNIVTIEDYDVKKHTEGIGWDIFIRMELLTPLNKYFSMNAPSERDVIQLGIDICKALEGCQKYNIVHRDIKPSNIFVSDTGEYKLGDFGIARTLEKTSSGLSKKGTYTYMAPEVFKGEPYGPNVDLYSLGIVMYKILNNNLEPFRKNRTHTDEDNALTLRINGEPIPFPANAGERLAKIIIKACSYNPKERYEGALQMRTALESLLQETSGNSSVEDQQSFYGDEASADETIGIFGQRKEADDSYFEKDTYRDDDGQETVGIFGQRKTPSENAGDKIKTPYGISGEQRKNPYESVGEQRRNPYDNAESQRTYPYDKKNAEPASSYTPTDSYNTPFGNIGRGMNPPTKPDNIPNPRTLNIREFWRQRLLTIQTKHLKAIDLSKQDKVNKAVTKMSVFLMQEYAGRVSMPLYSDELKDLRDQLRPDKVVGLLLPGITIGNVFVGMIVTEEAIYINTAGKNGALAVRYKDIADVKTIQGAMLKNKKIKILLKNGSIRLCAPEIVGYSAPDYLDFDKLAQALLELRTM